MLIWFSLILHSHWLLLAARRKTYLTASTLSSLHTYVSIFLIYIFLYDYVYIKQYNYLNIMSTNKDLIFPQNFTCLLSRKKWKKPSGNISILLLPIFFSYISNEIKFFVFLFLATKSHIYESVSKIWICLHIHNTQH